MYRELTEEVGLQPQHVKILGRTRHWLRYDVPHHWVRRDCRVQLPRAEADLVSAAHGRPRLRRVPAALGAPRVRRLALERRTGCRCDSVIEFKREVYRRALTELERFIEARPHPRRGRLYGHPHPMRPASYAEPAVESEQ